MTEKQEILDKLEGLSYDEQIDVLIELQKRIKNRIYEISKFDENHNLGDSPTNPNSTNDTQLIFGDDSVILLQASINDYPSEYCVPFDYLDRTEDELKEILIDMVNE